MDNKEILEILDGNDLHKKREIIYYISTNRCKEFMNELVKRIQVETNIQIKEQMLLTIKELYCEEKLELILSLLNSEDVFSRNGAIDIINSHSIENYDLLRQTIKKQNKDVRKFLIDSLDGNLRDEVTEILLERLKNDEDLNVKIRIVEILGENSFETSVNDIEEILMTEKNTMLICAGLEALWKIGESSRYKEILSKHYEDFENPFLVHSLLKYTSILDDYTVFKAIDKVINNFEITLFISEIINALENTTEKIPKEIVEKLKNAEENIGDSIIHYKILKLIYRNECPGVVRKKALKMIKEKEYMIKLAGIELLKDSGNSEDLKALNNLSMEIKREEIQEAIYDAFKSIKGKSV